MKDNNDYNKKTEYMKQIIELEKEDFVGTIALFFATTFCVTLTLSIVSILADIVIKTI